jgi:hypothetical protein
MGYTHYWNKQKELPQNKWDAFIEDAKIILIHETQAQELLCSEYDKMDTPPVIDKDTVRFNGKDNEGHETFYFTRVASDEFSFCKTAYKPYDKYVVRVLLLAEKHFGKCIEVSSDGDWDKIRRETLYEEVQNVGV